MEILHLGEASSFLPLEHFEKATYYSPAIQAAANAFTVNASRANGLLVVPGYAFKCGTVWQTVSGRVIRKHFPNGIPTQEQLAPLKETMNREANAMRMQLFLSESDEDKEYSYAHGCYNIEAFATRFPPLRHWLEGIIESGVIQSWTAFEVLAERLHSTAREFHPECFTPELLARKYRFRSLQTLADSYKRAFNDDPSVCHYARSKETKSLALLRHLLVHSKGVVDQMHIDQRSEAPTVDAFDKWGLGQAVKLNGMMIRKLIDPVMFQAYLLAAGVDAWIKKKTP